MFSVKWVYTVAISATLVGIIELYTAYQETLSRQVANVGQDSIVTFRPDDNSATKLATEIKELSLEKIKLEEELLELESEIAQHHLILNTLHAKKINATANSSLQHRAEGINLPRPIEPSLQSDDGLEQIRATFLDNFLIDHPSRVGEQAGALDTIERAAQTFELDGSSITYVDCNDTICRIDAVFADAERTNELASLLADRIGWNSALEIHFNSRRVSKDGDTKATTIYLSRAGKELPSYSPTL